MLMKRWEDLPDSMRNDAVRKYYERLRRKQASLLLKRAFDLTAGVALLAILSPALIAIGIWVRADSPGPAIFRQTRITQYGRRFRICKFRTMVTDAEKLGTQVTTQNDSRITRAGSFLRKYRLDETPQLINIIAGDMSFVGTRPEVPRYADQYNDEMKATLLLPAGATSEASILYKDEDRLLAGAEDADKTYVENILPEKMRYNLRDIENFSFLRDIGTMAKTVAAVFGK